MAATRLRRGVLFAGLLLLSPWPAATEPVNLKARSGDMEITGDLISADGKNITVNSPALGVVVLEAQRFECTGPGCAALRGKDDFSIQGSNTIGAALMPALIEAYAATENLRVEKRVGASAEEIGLDLMSGPDKASAIDLRSHGSGTAFPALAKGAAEIGASSRPIKPEEEKSLIDAGLTVNAHVLALDGILVLVSPDNPVANLSLEQIAGIFSGKVTDWADVGGTPGPITVYARDEKSGTWDSFNSLVMQPRNLKLVRGATRKESSVELSDEVAQNVRAIGFAGFAYLRNAKALGIRSACETVYTPSQFHVKTEEYPLSRRLFLYTTNRSSVPRAQAVVNYALSDVAQKTILDNGFIDQSFDSLSFAEQPERITIAFNNVDDDFNMNALKEVVTLADSARRLSTTYRFEKNDFQLDLKAKQDVARLARFLTTPAAQGKQVLLLGFADSGGPFEANRSISLARAETVRNAVLADGGNKIDPRNVVARGYSETLPVDCNTTAEGRAKNRRVEVWMRDQPRQAPATVRVAPAAPKGSQAGQATGSVRPAAPRQPAQPQPQRP
jgi:phosphate transport system substrate-binding protein